MPLPPVPSPKAAAPPPHLTSAPGPAAPLSPPPGGRLRARPRPRGNFSSLLLLLLRLRRVSRSLLLLRACALRQPPPPSLHRGARPAVGRVPRPLPPLRQAAEGSVTPPTPRPFPGRSPEVTGWSQAGGRCWGCSKPLGWGVNGLVKRTGQRVFFQ